MRRLVLLVVAAGLSAVAFVMPRPPEPEPPSFEGAVTVDQTAGARGSVWYCPWLAAGAVRDSWMMLASAADVELQVTLPNPIPNEAPDEVVLEIAGPGAEPLEIASIVRRGDAPGFVEFDSGPAAAVSVSTADSPDGSGALVSGDRCITSVPKLWHLPGGTTREGRTTILRLFNPFPEPAKVTVGGTSEFGDVGLLGLTSIDVVGRSWMDVNLNELVPLLDDLSLTVSSEEGLVIPALQVVSSRDEATWPGTGLATTWEFPVVRQTGLVPYLVVSNPGDESVEVEVDVFTNEGPVPAARTASVAARKPLRVPLEDLGGPFFGIAVRATGPVAAVVVAGDVLEEADAEEEPAEPPADRIAGTVGAEAAAQRWLLPGPGAIPAAASTVWLMNSGGDPATVSLVALGLENVPPDKVLIQPGHVRRMVLPQRSSISGYVVESSAPISAAWSVETGNGVAFVPGVSIDG